MKTKFYVHLVATAGQTVEVEIDTKGLKKDQIADLVYEAACEICSLDECEVADWTGEFDVTGRAENGEEIFYYTNM